MAHHLHHRGLRPGHLIARSGVLAWLLAACNPAGAPASTTPAPAPAPSPATSAPTVAANLELRAVAVELPGRYTTTHGELVSGLATPWAAETAEQLGLELPRLARAMGIAAGPSGRLPVILTSPAHTTGEWTYVRSDAARVHQLLSVRTDAAPVERVVLLATDGPPDAQIIDVFSASWILALAGREGQPVATLRLGTRIPHEIPGLWDAIATSLRTVDGALEVEIEYGHTGGGDPCEQRFTFRVRAEAEPTLRLVLVRQEHHQAPCGVLGMGSAQ